VWVSRMCGFLECVGFSNVWVSRMCGFLLCSGLCWGVGVYVQFREMEQRAFCR